jgi:2-oxoglutarate dehydrogenase E2 component (dihydrolipoamide succinyltransferase)
MAKIEIRLPEMGESVAEATITNWIKSVGDRVEEDEVIVEVATDKVDSEVVSEYTGVLIEQRFAIDEVAEVGAVIAIIETEGGSDSSLKLNLLQFKICQRLSLIKNQKSLKGKSQLLQLSKLLNLR